MGIFSRVKASKEKKDPKPTRAEEPKAPAKRQPYIPRYAVRDALQCAPTTWKQDSYDAFRKAHQERFTREQAEMNQNGWSNPKLSSRLSMSRNSSALSVAIMDGSRPASSRRHSAHANPFAAASSSYTSTASMVGNDPPVPAIPAQYASQASSAGPSTPRSLSRNSSFHKRPQSLEAHLQSGTSSRPGTAIRHSYAGHPTTSIMRKPAAHDFGSVPIESAEETPVDHGVETPTANTSSAASTLSESSGERIEMPARHDSPHDSAHDTPHDSPQMAPLQHDKERVYPSDPRKLGKAPEITIDESTPPARKYFSHPTKPAEPSPATPPAPPKKKARFSLIRRSQVVAAR